MKVLSYNKRGNTARNSNIHLRKLDCPKSDSVEFCRIPFQLCKVSVEPAEAGTSLSADIYIIYIRNFAEFSASFPPFDVYIFCRISSK